MMSNMKSMFDLNKIETLFKSLYLQKETLQFKINVYQEKFNMYKKLNFPDILIYEQKKEQNSRLHQEMK